MTALGTWDGGKDGAEERGWSGVCLRSSWSFRFCPASRHRGRCPCLELSLPHSGRTGDAFPAAASAQPCPTLLQPARLLCPWGSPGKSTGVCGHFPPSGDLPNPGIEPTSPVSSALQVDFFTHWAVGEGPIEGLCSKRQQAQLRVWPEVLKSRAKGYQMLKRLVVFLCLALSLIPFPERVGGPFRKNLNRLGEETRIYCYLVGGGNPQWKDPAESL